VFVLVLCVVGVLVCECLFCVCVFGRFVSVCVSVCGLCGVECVRGMNVCVCLYVLCLLCGVYMCFTLPRVNGVWCLWCFECVWECLCGCVLFLCGMCMRGVCVMRVFMRLRVCVCGVRLWDFLYKCVICACECVCTVYVRVCCMFAVRVCVVCVCVDKCVCGVFFVCVCVSCVICVLVCVFLECV